MTLSTMTKAVSVDKWLCEYICNGQKGLKVTHYCHARNYAITNVEAAKFALSGITILPVLLLGIPGYDIYKHK